MCQQDDNTAFSEALTSGETDTVRRLVELKCDVNAKNKVSAVGGDVLFFRQCFELGFRFLCCGGCVATEWYHPTHGGIG